MNNATNTKSIAETEEQPAVWPYFFTPAVTDDQDYDWRYDIVDSTRDDDCLVSSDRD